MPDTLTFRFDADAPDGRAIKAYVPKDLQAEVTAFMNANGAETSIGMEHAFGIDDAIIGLLVAGGGFAGVAKILQAYFSRHQHRKVVVKAGDEAIEISGMSPDEIGKALGEVLDVVAERQRAADESWHRILQEMPDPPRQLPPERTDAAE
jgi:hypothetical protein